MHQILIDLLIIVFVTSYGVTLCAIYVELYNNVNYAVPYKNLNLPLFLIEYLKYKFHDSTRPEIDRLYKVVLVTYYSFVTIVSLPLLVISSVIYVITKCVVILYSYTRHSQEINLDLPVYSLNDTNSSNVNVMILPPPPSYTMVEFTRIEASEVTPPYEFFEVMPPSYEDSSETSISDLPRNAVISTRPL